MAKKSLAKSAVRTLIATLGLTSFSMAVPPLTTVPWNGHVGAASFTFDDAMENQVKNLTPILEEIPDVRVTFFLSNMGGNSLRQNGAGFAKLANMGNEIGNHTDNHLQLPDQDDAKLKSEITDFATEIEKVMAENGAEINITSHATPFCANNEKVSGEINQHHFINRDCGWHGRNDWDVEPEWLGMASRVWNSSETADTELLEALDTAAFIGDFSNANPWDVQVKGGSWLVLLNHGVSDEGGMSITPEAIKKAFQRALKNDLWVAPFSTVGAYHKAHFIMDKAEGTANDKEYKISWEMPHPHMPKSIPLKVKLNEEFLKESGFTADDNIVIEQNNNEIQPDENGIYTIEFCDLSLTIKKSAGTSKLKSTISTKRKTDGNHSGIFDLNGKRLNTRNRPKNSTPTFLFP